MDRDQQQPQAPDGQDGLSAEELEAQKAAELPDREAMSIINTQPVPFTIAEPPDGFVELPPDPRYPEETM